MSAEIQKNNFSEKLDTIVLIGNHLPRMCGIATFSTDLAQALSRESPESDCWVVAMNDIPDGYAYPSRVRFEVNQNQLQEYRLAADFLNINHVDTVCVQHEFGIFGGKSGSYILAMLRTLRMPVITTLHTVLQNPDPDQYTVMDELIQISDRIVVMSNLSMEILHDLYNFSDDKIIYIPHGIPDIPFIDPNYYKDQFGVEGRRVILTFGLLSPGKGIEYMINALPEVVARYPETVYIVLGATHPHIKREFGEEYRHSLQRRARTLKVGDHVIFHNRFVSLKELSEFLGCADIYVTPYLQKEQVVSGTLAYAMGTGKAVISTPYWYAEEMLSESRGKIVPFHDSSAIASEIINLFDHEIEMHAMRKRTYKFTRSMIWKEAVREYLRVFYEAKQNRQQKHTAIVQATNIRTTQLELPEVNLDHLRTLTDDTGLLQHARFGIPKKAHGYCTDDNARGILAVLMAQDKFLNRTELNNLANTYLSFIEYSFNEQIGRFRNFMTYDHKWKEEVGSEDSHGRALWALGVTVSLSKSDSQVGIALELFEQALRIVEDFSSPRAYAFSLLGINAYRKHFSGDSTTRRIQGVLAERLLGMFESNSTVDWPWIEDTLTYANGKIPHALIDTGKNLEDNDMTKAGLRMLHWLVHIQKDVSEHFAPIGNNGWYNRYGKKARFDQQPIEAEAMIEACLEAYDVTGDIAWFEEATHCFEWFLGRNDLQTPIYDYTTGGCRDGLQSNGANQNQGAESTIAWLLSVLTMYKFRSMQIINIKNNEKEQKKQKLSLLKIDQISPQ
jgi:glycosyltransferase involved in cell wall biosynthesis